MGKAEEWVKDHRWPLGVLAVGLLVLLGYVLVVHQFTSESTGSCPPYTTGTGKTSTPQPPSSPSPQQVARAKAAARSLRRLAAKQGKAPSLESAEPIRPINVTGTQGIASADILLAASPAFPRGLSPTRITVQVPQRFRRVDEKGSTQYLPAPKHSAPKLLESRKLVTFEFCINLSNGSVAGGTYAGQVVAAVPGYEPGTVTVPVNIKDSDWFVKVWLATMVLAFLLLLFQAGQAEWNAQVDRGDAVQSRRAALKKPLGDLFGFWATTIGAIALVFGATWGVYTNDPAWGSNHVGSFIALVGTAVAAAGLGNLFAPARPKTDGAATEDTVAGEGEEDGGGDGGEEAGVAEGDEGEGDEGEGDEEDADEGGDQPTPEGTTKGHRPRARRAKTEGSGKPDPTGEEAGS